MAKHGAEKSSGKHRRESGYRPAVERLEERLPPGKMSFLDLGLADLSQIGLASGTLSTQSNKTGTATPSTATPQFVPLASPSVGDSSSTDTSVGGTAGVKPWSPSAQPSNAAPSSGDVFQSLNSLLQDSSLGALLLSARSTALASGSTTGFGSSAAVGSFSPLFGTGNLGFIVGPAINASRLVASQSETAIGTDPSNPNRVAMQANDNNFNVPTGTRSVQAYSDNAFRTYRQGFTTDSGDPTVSYDIFGNFWRASIDVGLNGIDVAASADNGRSFFFSTVLPDPFPTGILTDQPRLKTGPSGVGDIPFACWVEYTPFSSSGALGVVAAAIPIFGNGVAGPPEILELVGPPGFNLDAMAIGPHGEASFGYLAANGDVFVSSDLDGMGPSTPTVATFAAATNIPEAGMPIPAQSARNIQACPRLAYDRSPGPHNGRLYLTYTGDTVGTADTNIFVQYSDSFGGSWSPPKRVNDDRTQNSQFFSDIAVDQTTGNVFVAWYDARQDLGRHSIGDTDGVPNTDVEVWGTMSIDSGLTWSKNQRISPGISNGPSMGNYNDPAGGSINQFGDYLGVDFDEGRAWVVWTDNSNNPSGNFNRPEADIVVASVLINRGSGYTAIGDRFKTGAGGGDVSSSSPAELLLNPTFTEVDGLSIFPMRAGTPPAPDWFKFTAPASGVLTVDMDITPAWPTEGQLGMRLYQRNPFTGSLVQEGISEIPGSATPQEISVPVVAGQVYFLYCHGITGNGIAGTGTYRLRFNIV